LKDIKKVDFEREDKFIKADEDIVASHTKLFEIWLEIENVAILG
jgi:hypothetical protein